MCQTNDQCEQIKLFFDTPLAFLPWQNFTTRQYSRKPSTLSLGTYKRVFNFQFQIPKIQIWTRRIRTRTWIKTTNLDKPRTCVFDRLCCLWLLTIMWWLKPAVKNPTIISILAELKEYLVDGLCYFFLYVAFLFFCTLFTGLFPICNRTTLKIGTKKYQMKIL